MLLLLSLVWCSIYGLTTARAQAQTSWNATSQSPQNQTVGSFQYVDPLIGTSAGGMLQSFETGTVLSFAGHVFPGATLPFGMVKAVADVSGENQGGFSSDGSNIIGFSHMHDSGECPNADYLLEFWLNNTQELVE
jgi:putative alpha-1,2-mannosidase